jgi:hypothetical protein
MTTEQFTAGTTTTSTRTTTRHIKVDARFAGLLSEDFGVETRAILQALSGEPQREAIALVEWASKADEPAKAIVAWGRKNRRGSFRKARRNMTPAEQRKVLDCR